MTFLCVCVSYAYELIHRLRSTRNIAYGRVTRVRLLQGVGRWPDTFRGHGVIVIPTQTSQVGRANMVSCI